MASSPAAALPPESPSSSTNSTSPPSSEASAPPPVSEPPPSSPPPPSPPASFPPPSLPPPLSPPPSSPPPLSSPPSSPPPLHFSPPLPASFPPPPVSTPPPQYSSPPPPDSPDLPAPIFLSPPPLSPNVSSTPSSPTLPPSLPSPPTPPSSSDGSTPPSLILPPPSLPSPSPPASFNPPPSADVFLPPPPPKRPVVVPPSRSSIPSASNNNVDSNKSSGGSDVNLPMVAGIAAGIALFFLLIGIVACVCCRKKKKKSHNSINYYPDTGSMQAGGTKKLKEGSGSGSDNYNLRPAPLKWNNGGQDGVMKLPPPPGMAWNASHTPPAAINSENSVNYSGPNGQALQPSSPSITLGFIKSTFSYEELAAATNGFSDENILGQGGFGYVHKGVLPNGQEVAVKQLKAGSGQGEREFQAEVEIISRVHHRHLASLVGYCIVGSQRLLVYEFVPNKTLEFHLHGKNQPTMDWPTRMRIALGSAKGLAYLHEDCHPRIIHRDIKASNILLDYRFEAKVADFGLAKLSSDNYTHISTRVMGTFGYLAPEYASSGKLSEKSDVFSFGVMLLELITGKRPVHSNPMEDSLVDWARPLLTQALTENYDELVDLRLEGNYSKTEMARMVACAATSVRHSAKMRPKMSQIVRALEGDSSLEDLTEGVRPGQSMLFTSSSEVESGSYASNMSRFRRAALDSKELSQEYSGGLTSDYGLNPSSSSSSGEISTAMPHPDRAGLQL